MEEEVPCGSKFLSNFEDVNDFVQQTLKTVLGATKCSNEMPAAGDDFDYYSSFPAFQDVMNTEGKRLLHIAQSILKHQNVKINLGSGSGAAEIEDKLDLLMDANDQILERVGSWLDEAAGLKKTDDSLVVATATPKAQSTASWNKQSPGSQSSPMPSFRLLSARNIQRPQIKFKDKVDNSHHPFRPIIKHKPNALKTLEVVLWNSLPHNIAMLTDPDAFRQAVSQLYHKSLKLPENVTPEDSEAPGFAYPHPYLYELDNLQLTPGQTTTSEPQTPQPVADTPLRMIDTVDGLQDLVKQLKSQAHIAVDLEHHSYRTFQGITCLMQISTRSHDFLVDTLVLRSDLHLLNDVFTDPGIVKVFHGADSDIEWLQRDLGLYVVNMFDTGQASRVMNLGRFSLAYLLQQYCEVTADKQYQLADWRIRPLPQELIKYAREDTHYLLYIYDTMKNELIERGNENQNLLMSVLQRSKQVASKVYTKPSFTTEDYMGVYMKNQKLFNSQQLMALQELFAWRDETARLEDESCGYVLPNHMLLQMCVILPREKQGILACCNPIPPLVRQYLAEMHAIITKARESPLHKITPVKRRQPTELQHPKYNVDSMLNCPHDLSHTNSVDDNVATVLDSSLVSKKSSLFPMDTNDAGIIVLKDAPILTIFAHNTPHSTRSKTQRLAAEIKASFANPYVQFLPDEVKTDKTSPVKLKHTLPLHMTKWILKPSTKKRKDVEDVDTPSAPPKKKSRTDLHTERYTAADVEIIEKTDDDKKALPQDLEVPLRFQVPSKKKKRNRNTDMDIIEAVQKHDAEEAETIAKANFALGQDKKDNNSEKTQELNSHKHKKKKKDKKGEKASSDKSSAPTGVASESAHKSGVPVVESTFKPYDYSQCAKDLLKGPPKTEKLDYFDPIAKMRKSKAPKVSRSNIHSNKGKKSFTWKT